MLRIRINNINLPSNKRSYLILLFLLSIILIAEIFYIFYQAQLFDFSFFDWRVAFHPAVKEFLAGRSPYTVKLFYNPPWVLLPLIPLSFLPDETAGFIMAILALGSYAYLAYRFGAKPFALAIFIFSPPIIRGIFDVNVDWLAALGLLLPPQIGLFFLLIKPQIGVVVAIYWAVQAWRKGKWRELIRVFLPIMIAFAFSFFLYGLWPLKFPNVLDVPYNISPWPYAIPLGVFLIIYSLKKRKIELNLLSIPLLTPYFAPYSLPVPLLSLVQYPYLLLIIEIGFWIIRRYQTVGLF